MTILQFAKDNGIEIVGRLSKKSCDDEVFNYRTCEYVTEKTIYWEDEAGNTFQKECGEWYAWDPEGNEY